MGWILVDPVPGAGPSVHRPPLVALRISHHEMKEVQTTLPSYVEPFDWVTPRSPMHRVGSKGNPQLIVTVHGPYRATSGGGRTPSGRDAAQIGLAVRRRLSAAWAVRIML